MSLKSTLRGRERRGNTVIEFAIVAVFLVPLFLGTINLGLSLSYNLQVAQVARDAGHMYVRQLDFSLVASQEVVVRMASGMGLNRTGGGKGVVMLTKVLFIGADQCATGGLPEGGCPNLGRAVIVQRHIIGEASLRARIPAGSSRSTSRRVRSGSRRSTPCTSVWSTR